MSKAALPLGAADGVSPASDTKLPAPRQSQAAGPAAVVAPAVSVDQAKKRPQLPSMSARSTGGVSSLLEQEPETTIGMNVRMKGELQFERLLRVDGTFEGTLLSSGSLIVGPSGTIRGNINNMKELVCEGKVLGNIVVDRLILRGSAVVVGDITAKRMFLDEECSVSGQIMVHRAAPAALDAEGQVIHSGAPTPAKKPAGGPTPRGGDAPKMQPLSNAAPAPAPAAAAKPADAAKPPEGAKAAESKPADAPAAAP